MKLTIEENREALKRYRHIKPVPHPGGVPCSARCPGTVRSCTLMRGHSGPHVAHGSFKRVLAVWDRKSEENRDRVVGPLQRPGTRDGGLRGALDAFRNRAIWRAISVEEVFLLVLALALVGFAIDWALRIVGLR